MLGPCEPCDSSAQPWTFQQAEVAKAWAYVGIKEPRFMISTQETWNSKSKSVYFMMLQGYILEWQVGLVSEDSIYKP